MEAWGTRFDFGRLSLYQSDGSNYTTKNRGVNSPHRESTARAWAGGEIAVGQLLSLTGFRRVGSCNSLAESLSISAVYGLKPFILALERDAHLIFDNSDSSVDEVSREHVIAIGAIVADTGAIDS